jgi:hypothetical protein
MLPHSCPWWSFFSVITDAWCHHSDKLPVELQEDTDLVSFLVRTVVLYLDTIVYGGDDTVDNDTCKNHTQLHADRYFGGPMQSNTETGGWGLNKT